MRPITRRRAIHGLLNGAAISVGVPVLDCWLNDHGTAWAEGTELPVCYATWSQGLGFPPGFWEPKTSGANYELPDQFKALAPFKSYLNIYSGMKVYLDGRPCEPHGTGPITCSTGVVPEGPSDPIPPSTDSLIADVIGRTTRFRSLEVACHGSPESYSRRGGTVINPSEISPVALYKRVFGSDFKDPNAAEFTPDPATMLKHSVLSAIADERRDFVGNLGPTDRARMDEYFTSLRQLEHQLELELQKPAPMAACTHPSAPKEAAPGMIIDDSLTNNRLFSELLAHALACGQTRIVNMVLSPGTSNLRRLGSEMTFHLYTHEEQIDPKTGRQNNVAWFQYQVVDALATTISAFARIKEGDRTLLDRMLVYYFTDTGNARVHSVENMPLMTIGNASGRLKSGIHIESKASPVTRVGLTLQQLFGVPVSTWGKDSNTTSKTITEVLA